MLEEVKTHGEVMLSFLCAQLLPCSLYLQIVWLGGPDLNKLETSLPDPAQLDVSPASYDKEVC
jgi:hypothetical protein